MQAQCWEGVSETQGSGEGQARQQGQGAAEVKKEYERGDFNAREEQG